MNAEYLVESVALGVEEYYAGVGEAPGVWSGGWATGLGLSGLVEADDLRAVVDGLHPGTGESLVKGRERRVHGFDLTFSAPKSVSLAWALGTPGVHAAAVAAHVGAVEATLGFLEARAAVTRRQEGGVRVRVVTDGWVVAGFVHRTSRAGDPQFHTHCVVPNVVRRSGDGHVVAIDAEPLYAWKLAAGAVYQNEVQHRLTVSLGAGWGPDVSCTREMAGMHRDWLRVFSKRTVQIEAELTATGHDGLGDRRLRMIVDDQASLATRPAKDHTLTPNLLEAQWQTEATAAGVPTGRDLSVAVEVGGEESWVRPARDVLWAGLVDPEKGLCANEPRFGEPDVVKHLCAVSAGRFTLSEIVGEANAFLASSLVVRLTAGEGRAGATWSTAAHRALEDRVLDLLDGLQIQPTRPIPATAVGSALAANTILADDQVAAVEVLCAGGSAITVVLAPAGYGKTAMVHAAAAAANLAGHRILGVATTAKAVAELAGAGVPGVTVAQLRVDLSHHSLPPGTVVVLDEVSQTSTIDAETVLTAVAECEGGRVWVLGDPRQGRSVRAGGLAAELQARVDAGLVTAATLTTNRRQVDPGDRDALTRLRAGDASGSQAVRSDHGWEHTATTPETARGDMAAAIADDLSCHGHDQVVALTVSHTDAEDLADRIRTHLTATGVLTGPGLSGPGWTGDRDYRTGDRVVFHARHGARTAGLVNGTTATVTSAGPDGLTVTPDHDPTHPVHLLAAWVQGTRVDGSPRLSHAWARTIDGAQGGTWTAAHLLGTAALDTYRGYVGQSRSRQPTHTWNTTPLGVHELDVAGLQPDTAAPEDVVAAALARTPDPTMAAVDDPMVVARRIQAELNTLQPILATRPALAYSHPPRQPCRDPRPTRRGPNRLGHPHPNHHHPDRTRDAPRRRPRPTPTPHRTRPQPRPRHRTLTSSPPLTPAVA